MKKARKILVALMAMVMLLGTSMTVCANGTDAPIAQMKSITAKNTTVYTNGDAEVAVSYTWDKVKGGVTQNAPAASLTADSNNKGVVKVIGFEGSTETLSSNGKKATTTTTLKLNAIANGKAKITIKDFVSGKKKVITVTVKTWADDIAFSGDAVTVDGEGNYTVTIAKAKNAKVNLGAAITNDASNKGISYKVEANKGISVDAKGNVKVTKNDATEANITVKSKDGKVEKTVKVALFGDKAVGKVTILLDTNAKNVNTPGLLNGKNVLNMKANKTSNAYTYQLNWKEKDVKAEDLSFVSSKSSVATVDANGKITAKANGTAKITVSPKYNSAMASKTITVKVTTNVENVSVTAENFTIVANNKATASINGKTNANASNKTVLYKLVSVTPEGSTTALTSNSDMKKYASVSNKGVVKMKKAATATVLAYAKADATVARSVIVTGVVPVKTVEFEVSKDDAVTANTKNTAFTVYRTGKDTAQNLSFKVIAKDADGNEMKNAKITWTSSKPAIAEVVDGKIIAKANGKTNITAIAESGVKKTVAVTVMTKAYDIVVAKAQTVSGNEAVVVEGKDTATKYTFSKVIAAKTNADASDKKVTYTISGSEVASKDVKLAAGETKDIVITTNDKAATKTIKLICISSEEAAKDVTLAGLDAEMLLTVGSSATPVFTVTAEEGKTVVDPTAVQLVAVTKADAKIVTIKNGVITAKKEGVATVKATYGNTTIESKIYVGRNTATIEKELEKIITAKMKAENYDYLGVKTKFDSKKNTFTLDIKNPTNDITNIEGTGLFAYAKEVYVSKQDTLGCNSITMTVGEDTWVAENAMNGLGNVYHNGTLVLENKTVTEAADYVMENVLAGAEQLKDWNGKDFAITFELTDTREAADNKVFTHTVVYNVTTKMDSKLYEATVDAAIADAVSNMEGLELAYDAASNSVEIAVVDGDKAIADVKETSKATVIPALESVFADAKVVTLNAKVYVDGVLGIVPANETVTKTNNGQGVEFINELLDEYVAKLAEHGVVTLADLNGVVMSADVTFAVGAQEYNYTYTANALVDESVFDKAADVTIAEAVKDNAAAFTDGTISYNDAENTLNVFFKADAADKTIVEFEGAGFKNILDAIIGGAKDAVSAVVVTDAVSTPIALDEDAAENVILALITDVETIADLDGDVATIKVVYASANGASQKTLVYTVVFDVEEKVTEEATSEETTTTEDAAPAEDVKETAEETTEDVVEETVEETTEEVVEETVEETTEEVVEETVEETTEAA